MKPCIMSRIKCGDPELKNVVPLYVFQFGCLVFCFRLLFFASLQMMLEFWPPLWSSCLS